MRKNMILGLVIVIALGSAATAMAAVEPMHTINDVMAAQAISENVSANTTANATNSTNLTYSEVNMYIFADDPGLQLYITAEPGTVTPMLTNFSVTMHAPGNSSYYVTDSALVNSPTHVLKRGTFAYVKTITLTGANSGVANFTFVITSGTLRHTSSFSYLLEFMSPTSYISYEHQKLAPPGQLTYTQGGEIAAGGIVLGLGLLRLFLPVMRRKIQKDNKKEGMVLLASN